MKLVGERVLQDFWVCDASCWPNASQTAFVHQLQCLLCHLPNDICMIPHYTILCTYHGHNLLHMPRILANDLMRGRAVWRGTVLIGPAWWCTSGRGVLHYDNGTTDTIMSPLNCIGNYGDIIMAWNNAIGTFAMPGVSECSTNPIQSNTVNVIIMVAFRVLLMIITMLAFIPTKLLTPLQWWRLLEVEKLVQSPQNIVLNLNYYDWVNQLIIELTN